MKCYGTETFFLCYKMTTDFKRCTHERCLCEIMQNSKDFDDGFRRAMVTVFKLSADADHPEPFFDVDDIKFGIWQLERCPKTAELHYQAYLEANRAMRFKQWKRVVGNHAHIEEARKGRDACINYCSKEETRVEGPFMHGKLDQDKGGRPPTRLEAMRVILERIAEIGEIGYMKEDPVKYSMFKKEIRAALNVKRNVAALERLEEIHQNVVLRPWQQRVKDEVQKQLDEKDDRKIIWVWERPGKVGKSFLAGHLKVVFGAALCAGKADGVKYAYNGERVCIVDVPRNQLEFIGQLYTVAEELKNGRFFSSKYESEEKLFDPPVVIFFANEGPDYSKWSHDRIVDINLNL